MPAEGSHAGQLRDVAGGASGHGVARDQVAEDVHNLALDRGGGLGLHRRRRVSHAGATASEVRWALNGGTWTLWKKMTGTSVALPGLVKGMKTSLEVRGTNAQGAGPVATRVLSVR